MFDDDLVTSRGERAEPNARRAVVGRESDNTCVMPESPIDKSRERKARMPAQHTIGSGSFDFTNHDCVFRGFEDVLIDSGRRTVNNSEVASGHLEFDKPGQVRHPAF